MYAKILPYLLFGRIYDMLNGEYTDKLNPYGFVIYETPQERTKMNKKVLKSLEYNKILEKTAAFAATADAKSNIAALMPSFEFEEVKLSLELTSQAMSMIAMHGNLPAAVDAMLERKHGCFDAEPHHIHIISGETDPDAVWNQITQWEEAHGQ